LTEQFQALSMNDCHVLAGQPPVHATRCVLCGRARAPMLLLWQPQPKANLGAHALRRILTWDGR
jgi:hypothetical protein